MADPMMPPAAMGGGPVWDPTAGRYQDTVTTRDPTHSQTGSFEAGQLAPQTQAATEQTIADQGNLQTVRAQAMDAARAMDSAEQVKAQAMQADAQTQMQATRAAQAKYEAQMQAAMADVKAKAAQYAEAAKPELQSFGSKVASAIGMALGAYAATRAGTPNYAAQIVQMMQDKAQKEHEARLSAALHMYERSGAAPAQILAARKAAMDELEAGRIARGREVETQYQAAIAKNPQHAQKLQQELAEKKLAEDKDTRNFLASNLAQKTHDSRTDESKVVTRASTEGSPTNPGANKPTESESKLALLGKSMQDELAAIRKLPKLTSEDLANMQTDTLKVEAADKASEGGQVNATGVQLGRAVGAIPRSRYSSLPPEKQKSANAWDNAVEKYARVLTGAGMPAEEARRMARQNMPSPDDSPEAAEFKLNRMEREADRFVALGGPAAEKRMSGDSVEQRQPKPSGGQEAYRQSTAQALIDDAAAKAKTRAGKAKLDAADMQALEWAKSNRRDPRALGIIRKISEKLSGGAQ